MVNTLDLVESNHSNKNTAVRIGRLFCLALLWLSSTAYFAISSSLASDITALVSDHSNQIKPARADEQATQLVSAWNQLPLYFEQHRFNNASDNNKTQFLARGPNYNIGIRHDGVTLIPQQANKPSVQMHFDGAQASELTGGEPLKGKINYLTGKQSSDWKTGIASYATVQQKQIYPGIDVRYYGNQGQLEYDFIVSPETDVRQIQLVFDGVDSVKLDSEGKLLLNTPHGTIQQHKPTLYQKIRGQRQSVEGRYQLIADNRVGFQVEQYNKQYVLVIDPILEYSSYLGIEGTGDALRILEILSSKLKSVVSISMKLDIGFSKSFTCLSSLPLISSV